MKTFVFPHRVLDALLSASLTAATLTAATTMPALAAPSNAQLIVPGVSAGHLRLGRDGAAQLRKMAGPSASDAGMSQTNQVWVSKDKARNTLYLHTVSNGALDVAPRNGVTIDEIRVTSPFFRTRDGISTNSTLAHIKKALPNVVRAWHSGIKFKTVVYNDARHGIAFEFARDNATARCIGITTYIAGRKPDAGHPVYRDDVETLLRDR